MSEAAPISITFALYLLAMLAIGVIAYRATGNFADYILGGRRLGSVVTALSAGASDMSGWLLMGLPGAIYLSGLSEGWIAVGLVAGAWCNWYFVAGRLRVHTAHTRDSLTLPDYFTHRFEDRTRLLRVLSALVILVFFTVYCASGIVAGARLFESTFGVHYDQALWLGAASTVVYVFLGGFLAISWTDSIQATLMITALLVTPVFVLLALGDPGLAVSTIQSIDAGLLNPMRDQDTLAIVSLLAWGLGYFGQPHILVRFMAIDSVSSMARARRIGMTWMVLTLAGAVAVGLLGVAYYALHPGASAAVAENSERVFIELARLLFNPWVAGIILSGVLAAIMSTLSCQLLVCSSALTEDFYKAFFRRSAGQRELVWVGRAAVLAVAIIALRVASDPDSRVLGLVSYAWAGFGAAFGPVVLISVLWKRMTRNGALAGMLVGAATVIVWKAFAPIDLYEMVPGFTLASAAIVLVSLLDEAPDSAIQRRFEAADREFEQGSSRIRDLDRGIA